MSTVAFETGKKSKEKIVNTNTLRLYGHLLSRYGLLSTAEKEQLYQDVLGKITSHCPSYSFNGNLNDADTRKDYSRILRFKHMWKKVSTPVVEDV